MQLSRSVYGKTLNWVTFFVRTVILLVRGAGSNFAPKDVSLRPIPNP